MPTPCPSRVPLRKADIVLGAWCPWALMLTMLSGCDPSTRAGGGGEVQEPAPTEVPALEGDQDSAALQAPLDVPPVSVRSADIEHSFILTRLDAHLADDATVEQINTALGELDAASVFGAAGLVSQAKVAPIRARKGRTSVNLVQENRS